MSDKRPNLTRRRVLGGIATIGAASAAAGAGTMAYFSDTEESTDNTISAGTLNLEPAGSSDGSGFSISVSGLAPDNSGTQVGFLDLKNVGSIDGELDYEITDWRDYENGRNDAEVDAGDTSGGDPGQGAGELSNVLEIQAYVDRSPGNGARDDDVALTSGWVALSGGRVDTNVSVAAGEEVRIWVDARIPESTGNVVQSDSVEVDAAFYLDQT